MVFVIDTETTGLRGSPIDRVLEIGICEYDEIERTITPIYNEVIRYDDMSLFKSMYESYYNERMWIYDNGIMSLEDTLGAEKDLSTVVGEVREIVRGKAITSYNVPFDMCKFLYRSPWELKSIAVCPFDIMDMATDRLRVMAHSDAIPDKALQRRLISAWESFPDKWVRSLDAYRCLCPDDPVGLDGVQSHRASDDAVMEAHILDAIFQFKGL